MPTEADFLNTIADYLTFEFPMIVHGRGYLFDSVKKNSPPLIDVPPLENKIWKEFFISDIAEIISGTNINASERINGKIPYITASASNNGVTDFVSNENSTLESDCISVNSNGSVGYAFYHPYTALYSGDCRKLRLFIKNKHVALFVANQITAQREKYNYGYKMGTARLNKQKILLPVNAAGEPDFDYMEKYIALRENKLIQQYLDSIAPPEIIAGIVPLNKKIWRPFLISDLFKLEAGKGKGAIHLENDSNGISYLGATNRNNAVLNFVKPKENLIQRGNCIVFIRNGEGSIGYSVYKAEDFIATSDVTCGYADFLNKYIGWFITTVADKVRGKYNFNYKRSDTRLKRESLMLPINGTGEPDFAYMEAYSRNLFAQLLKKYLER